MTCFSLELLDEQEFGDSHEYDEDAIPAAQELGLLVSFPSLLGCKVFSSMMRPGKRVYMKAWREELSSQAVG